MILIGITGLLSITFLLFGYIVGYIIGSKNQIKKIKELKYEVILKNN